MTTFIFKFQAFSLDNLWQHITICIFQYNFNSRIKRSLESINMYVFRIAKDWTCSNGRWCNHTTYAWSPPPDLLATHVNVGGEQMQNCKFYIISTIPSYL